METQLPQITQLCDTLSRGPVVASELARTLGTIESEGRSAVYVKPAAAAFERIILSRDRTSGEARSVELILAQPGSVTVGLLTKLFGSFATPPKVSWDSPTRVRFGQDLGAERSRLCVVSATLVEGAPATEQGGVASLMVIPESR